MAYPYSYNNLRNLQLANQAMQANRDRLAQASQPQSNSPLGLPNTPSPGWIEMQKQRPSRFEEMERLRDEVERRGLDIDANLYRPEELREILNPSYPKNNKWTQRKICFNR